MNKLLLLACVMSNSILVGKMSAKENITLGHAAYASTITKAFGCNAVLPQKSFSPTNTILSNEKAESFCNEHRGKIGFVAGAASATVTMACIFFYWLSQTAK